MSTTVNTINSGTSVTVEKQVTVVTSQDNTPSSVTVIDASSTVVAVVEGIPTVSVDVDQKPNVHVTYTGGRGPWWVEGESYDTADMLYLLAHALDADEFTSDYNDSIAAMVTNISTNASGITTINEDIVTIDERLDSMDAATIVSDARILNSETAITTLEVDANTVGLLASDNASRLTVLEPVVAINVSQLSALADDVETLQNSLSSVASFTGTLKNYCEGVGSNNETISIPGTWDTEPKVSISFRSGSTYSFAYPLDDQQLVLGHGGVFETAVDSQEYEFVPTILLLKQLAYSTRVITWTSTEITATHPEGSEELTDESALSTTGTCTTLRFIGLMRLKNEDNAGVGGTMHLQVAIDGGDWQTLDTFYEFFSGVDSAWSTRAFDILRVLPSTTHTYKFRGLLVPTYAPDITRIITGQVFIDYVEEGGSGVVLADDGIISWEAVEV